MHLPLWVQEQVTLNLTGRHLFRSVPKQSVLEPRKISINEKRKPGYYLGDIIINYLQGLFVHVDPHYFQ